MSSGETKYSNSKKKPGKTKAFFICLVIASFLWLFHSLNMVYTRTFKIPVVFKNFPQNKRPLVPIPEVLTVDVKASGLKLALMLLNKSNKELTIDFNTLKSINRNQSYVLSASRLDFKQVFGFETQLRQMSPDTLYFSEKTGYQKNVALKVPLYIKCRPGFANKKPDISPGFITIYGDTADIDGIDTIYTQPVSLNGLAQNVGLKPLIVKPKPGIYTSVAEATVYVEVEKLLEQTIIIPINDINQKPMQHVNIFPASLKIKFTALRNNFNRQDTAQFRAMINSSNINPRTKKSPVFLSTLPGNVTVLDFEPKEVEILILKSK